MTFAFDHSLRAHLVAFPSLLGAFLFVAQDLALMRKVRFLPIQHPAPVIEIGLLASVILVQLQQGRLGGLKLRAVRRRRR
jgi:hypothetical protein